MSKKVSVIGAGVAGLASACGLARYGYDVDLFEKNADTGGRCRAYSEKGFTFDMGPSWYWMPDVFEDFYNLFGKTTSDFYDLVKLDPGFKIFFSATEQMNVPAGLEELYATFEAIEPGSADKLKLYLKEAAWKYETGMKQLAYKPSVSWTEFAHPSILGGLVRTDLLKPMSGYVRKFFKDDRLVKLMEFPVLFLGAMPDNIPALYSLMNHAALTQGTYYPMGGMYHITEAMTEIAKSLGVNFHFSANVEQILVQNGKATGLQVDGTTHKSGAVIAACDYHHAEQKLLDKPYRKYTDEYWNKRVMAPSCLIFYVGVRKSIKGLEHHNLFFDTDFETHAKEIYSQPQWPSDPMFYVCAPSKTDKSVAPEGMENLFILVPIAPDLEDDEYKRMNYFHALIKRIETATGESIIPDIIYNKSYCINDFVKDYNSFKGNAYGLANTLLQTAMLKPKMRTNKVKNLFYAGQLTVPGPGLPPSVISGQIAADQVHRHIKTNSYESIV